MSQYKYCPKCGRELIAIRENLDKCSGCKFDFYHNVIASAVGLIFNQQGQILMVRRAYDPGKGLWSIPGGFIDYNESAEKGLTREIKEELGIEINQFEYFTSTPGIYWYQDMGYRTLMISFKAKYPEGQKINLSDEATEWKWASLEEINLEEVGNEDVREVVGRIKIK